MMKSNNLVHFISTDLFGSRLSRKSDRNKPKTKFSNGIGSKKLQAKEYPSVLLVLAVVVQCSGSKEGLVGKK